eukprot:3928275-Amphidinium_carterae.1
MFAKSHQTKHTFTTITGCTGSSQDSRTILDNRLKLGSLRITSTPSCRSPTSRTLAHARNKAMQQCSSSEAKAYKQHNIAVAESSLRLVTCDWPSGSKTD